MTVVSDASPLINLARIGQLDLLRALYETLLIPEAVWREVVVDGAGQPGSAEVRAADWIQTQAIANGPLVQALRQTLGAGEAEAIVLALETDAALLLMDERLGRATAEHLGVGCMGLVGVALEAKHSGLIEYVRPLLDALRNVAGFHLHEALYQRVLQDEGEL